MQRIRSCSIKGIDSLVRNFFQHPTSTFINIPNHTTRLDMADKPTGYPPSWMNGEGHVMCLARTCRHVWKTNGEMQHRPVHLRSTVLLPGQGLEMFTDHQILLAMDKQTKCPDCGEIIVKENWTVKYLHQHMKVAHGKEDTATIPGFVKLLRKGLIEPAVAHLAYEPVHQRLLQKIMAWSEWPGDLGLAKFWGIEDYELGKFCDDEDVNHEIYARKLEQKITIPNQKKGKPPNYPMAPEEFLPDQPLTRDLKHSDFLRQVEFAWDGKRSSLKHMYDSGEI